MRFVLLFLIFSHCPCVIPCILILVISVIIIISNCLCHICVHVFIQYSYDILHHFLSLFRLLHKRILPGCWISLRIQCWNIQHSHATNILNWREFYQRTLARQAVSQFNWYGDQNKQKNLRMEKCNWKGFNSVLLHEMLLGTLISSHIWRLCG